MKDKMGKGKLAIYAVDGKLKEIKMVPSSYYLVEEG
jgi:hypothetical protein